MENFDEMELALRDAHTSNHVDELMKRYEKNIDAIKAGLSDLDLVRLNYIRNMAAYQKNWLSYRDYMSV